MSNPRDLRAAVIDAANVLGSPGPCPGEHCEGCAYEREEAISILYHALGLDASAASAYHQFEEIRDGRGETTVLSLRMPVGEANAIRKFARNRGITVSRVLREGWWNKARAESRPDDRHQQVEHT